MLNHPHRAYDELLTIDHVQFDRAAYRQHHSMKMIITVTSKTLTRMLTLKNGSLEWAVKTLPWRIGRSLRDCSKCLRYIDINYDWLPHVDRYRHDDFFAETVVSNDVEYMPPDARSTLNPEQLLVYDTTSSSATSPLFACRLTAVAAPESRTWSKSYLLICNRHLLVKSLPSFAQRRQVLQVINGQTLHSLLHLPIDSKYRPLAETPTVLSNLQQVFNNVKYLVIDEKSMPGLKTLGWIDLPLREIFPRATSSLAG